MRSGPECGGTCVQLVSSILVFLQAGSRPAAQQVSWMLEPVITDPRSTGTPVRPDLSETRTAGGSKITVMPPTSFLDAGCIQWTTVLSGGVTAARSIDGGATFYVGFQYTISLSRLISLPEEHSIKNWTVEWLRFINSWTDKFIEFHSIVPSSL